MSKIIADKHLAKVLTTEEMHDFAIAATIKYGTYVIENRALPDFRDGLKPVQRRILWAMDQANFASTGPMVKCARVTGEVMGKYHPHADSYGSLINMVNRPIPTIEPQGSTGYFGSAPSASRYTECRLAKYAEKTLLSSSYLAVSNTMPSYTGEFKEPLVLPALLPHLLFNGVVGIAVGVIVGMPPFEFQGVIKLIKVALTREVLVKDCNKHLKVKYPHPYNSEVLTSDAEIHEFFKTGTGRLTLGIGYVTDGLKMIVTRFPPNFSMEAAKERLALIDQVANVENQSGKDFKAKKVDLTRPRKMVIILKPSTPTHGRSDIFKKCAKVLNESMNLRINLIERIDEDYVKFKYCNMPDFVNQWTKWRKDLEVKRHLYDAEQSTKLLANLELQVLACQNLDKIIPIIKSKLPDVDARLAKALKISLDDAKYILSLTLRRLTGLSLTELQDKIKKETALRKASLHHAKHPAEKILLDLDDLVKGIL